MHILQMTTRNYGHITHDYQELCSAMWLEVVAISGYKKGDLPTWLLNLPVHCSTTDQTFFFPDVLPMLTLTLLLPLPLMLMLLPLPFQCVRVTWFKLEVYGSGGLSVSHSQMNKEEAILKKHTWGLKMCHISSPCCFQCLEMAYVHHCHHSSGAYSLIIKNH